MFFCIEINMKLFTAYEQFALYKVIVLQGKQKDVIIKVTYFDEKS